MPLFVVLTRWAKQPRGNGPSWGVTVGAGVGVHGRGGMRSAHHFHFRRSPLRLPVHEEEDFEFVCGTNDYLLLAKICVHCAARRYCRDCEVTFFYSCLGSHICEPLSEEDELKVVEHDDTEWLGGSRS
jgi:hypothetical protein